MIHQGSTVAAAPRPRLLCALLTVVALAGGLTAMDAVARPQAPERAPAPSAGESAGESAGDAVAARSAPGATHGFVRPQPGAENGRFAPDVALIVAPRSTSELKRELERANFRLDAVRAGAAVPRIYVSALPPDLPEIQEIDARKRVFLRSVLPLVLMANEELRQDRARLLELVGRLERDEDLPVSDRAWLDALAETFEVSPGDVAELVARVDAIPPSLALAQAIVESGWGTSRFALEGNALFGQRVWSDTAPAMTPERDPSVRVQAFDDLMQSVRSYMHNLNTHRAYAGLRAERARLAASGETASGESLAHGLESYAEIDGYVAKLTTLMRHNDLSDLDEARLQSRPLAAFVPRR